MASIPVRATFSNHSFFFPSFFPLLHFILFHPVVLSNLFLTFTHAFLPSFFFFSYPFPIPFFILILFLLLFFISFFPPFSCFPFISLLLLFLISWFLPPFPLLSLFFFTPFYLFFLFLIFYLFAGVCYK